MEGVIGMSGNQISESGNGSGLDEEVTKELLQFAAAGLGAKDGELDEFAREVICHVANVLQEAKRNRSLAFSLSDKPLREDAIAKLGEGRVIEAEKVILDAVGLLLTAPVLKKNGFSWRRGVAPEIEFRWKAGTSRGGKRGLSFAMLRHAMKPEQGAVYKEYSRLNAFPGIGDFTGSRVDCLRVLAAHELAHWLQYEPKVRRPDWDFKPPHGEGFRRLYRILREALSSMDGQR